MYRRRENIGPAPLLQATRTALVLWKTVAQQSNWITAAWLGTHQKWLWLNRVHFPNAPCTRLSSSFKTLRLMRCCQSAVNCQIEDSRTLKIFKAKMYDCNQSETILVLLFIYMVHRWSRSTVFKFIISVMPTYSLWGKCSYMYFPLTFWVLS